MSRRKRQRYDSFTPRKKRRRDRGDVCRSCKNCRSSFIRNLILIPFRTLWDVLFSWNVGLFMERCPRCAHHMAYHHDHIDHEVYLRD